MNILKFNILVVYLNKQVGLVNMISSDDIILLPPGLERSRLIFLYEFLSFFRDIPNFFEDYKLDQDASFDSVVENMMQYIRDKDYTSEYLEHNYSYYKGLISNV